MPTILVCDLMEVALKNGVFNFQTHGNYYFPTILNEK
jgi:hypothetical protein